MELLCRAIALYACVHAVCVDTNQKDVSEIQLGSCNIKGSTSAPGSPLTQARLCAWLCAWEFSLSSPSPCPPSMQIISTELRCQDFGIIIRAKALLPQQ